MFEIAVEHTFAAAHNLRNYKGKCERLHGHNYRVLAVVRGDNLDSAGMLCDFGDLKRALRDRTEELDHSYLNEHEAFLEASPSAENLARYLFEQIDADLRAQGVPGNLVEVRVWETDIQYASYQPR